MQALLVIDHQLEGLNSYTKANRANRYAGAKMKKDMEDLISWCINSQLKGIHFNGTVEISFTWVEPNRKRDLDNIAFAKKFILDALVKNGIIESDGWKGVCGFTDSFKVDKERPRVEVEIREVERGVTED